jgi:hypothetical protein
MVCPFSIGPESTRIVFHHGQYHRTNPQEHNSHLVVLMSQLQDAIQKMAAQVVKATRDSPGTALSTSSLLGESRTATAGGASEESLLNAGMSNVMTVDGWMKPDEIMLRVITELHFLVSNVMKHSNELARQLLNPLVQSLSDHFRYVLAYLYYTSETLHVLWLLQRYSVWPAEGGAERHQAFCSGRRLHHLPSRGRRHDATAAGPGGLLRLPAPLRARCPSAPHFISSLLSYFHHFPPVAVAVL